jgi:hypothetical protein
MRILQDCAWLKLGFDRRHLLIERIIVINLILEPLNCPEIDKKYGVTLFKQARAPNMAFADDINILARSRDSALSLLAILSESTRLD